MAAAESAPAQSGVNTRSRGRDTCDDTIPLLGADPVDLSDDQTGPNQLFAEIRGPGASDSDASMIDPWGKAMTDPERPLILRPQDQ